MSANNFFEKLDATTRRNFLKIAAMAGVSSSVLLSGSSLAFAGGDKKNDITIMNVALGLEHQAIAAYTAGAGLLKGDVLELAKKFLGQHQQHRDALAATVTKFGGKPKEAEKSYDIPGLAKGKGITLNGEGDVLQLAAILEAEATKAYLGAIPSLTEKPVIDAACKIMADEAQHTAVLNFALKKDPAPGYLK